MPLCRFASRPRITTGADTPEKGGKVTGDHSDRSDAFAPEDLIIQVGAR